MQAAYLSSLGETGDRAAMVRALARAEAKAGKFISPHLALMRLATAGVMGRRDVIEGLIRAAPLRRMLSPAMQAYWLATADQAAGRQVEARLAFERLRGSCEPVLRAAVGRRLAVPLVPVSAYDLETRAVLDRVAREVRHETQLAVYASGTGASPVVTHLLLVVLALVFVCELPGGSTDPENLFRLGALVVPLGHLHGQWWRLLTAIFLHYGPLHLALNMLGLLVLGRWLERLLGSRSYLVVYLFAGIGSSPPSPGPRPRCTWGPRGRSWGFWARRPPYTCASAGARTPASCGARSGPCCCRSAFRRASTSPRPA